MAGLALKVGGFGGVSGGAAPAYGTPQSYDSVTQAAFGPGATVNTPTTGDVLGSPTGFSVAFWTGVVALGLLVVIRHSLPGK
jgi:hypothetical protein